MTTTSAITARQVVDGRGWSITTAILYEVVSALARLAPGEEMTAVTDARPSVDTDVRAWCETTGNTLVEVGQHGRERRYRIRKTDRPRTGPGWALVVSDPGLEELLAPLGFALAAALGNSPVAIFFQGPACRVPSRRFTERLSGAHRAPFSVFARRGLAKAGHHPVHVKLRQLDRLGARLFVCGPSMEHFKVRERDLISPRVRIGTYPAFAVEMAAAGVQIYQ